MWSGGGCLCWVVRYVEVQERRIVLDWTVEPPVGFEPTTYRLQGGCSDQLS